MLKRSMTLLPATAMVAGIIIGASIFVQPSVISSHLPSARGIALAWLIAGALTLIGALVCAELASAIPETGGVYVWLARAWSPAAGFLWGWAMLWVMHSGIVAAIAVICARYAGHFVPLGDAGTRAVAVAAILLLSWINYLGVRLGSNVMTVLTLLKVLAVLGLVAVAFTFGEGHTATSAPAAIEPASLALAVGAGLFAYGGWHMVTYAAGEIVEPQRTIPRALVIGVLLVTASYLGLNAAYFHVLPIERVIASRSIAADAARAVTGDAGAAIVAGIVIVSTLGALNGVILAGPRVYYAMGKDGLLFRKLADLHPAHGTPRLAIALQAAVAMVLVITGTYGDLYRRVIYTEWIFFAAMAAGMLLLRRRADYAPLFRLPAAPVLVTLFVLASLAVVAAEIARAPLDSAIGLGIVIAGLPVYILWRRFATARSLTPDPRPPAT